MDLGRWKVVAGFCIFTALCACTSSSPEAASPATNWTGALSAIERANGGVYSFQFDGPPPAGAFYTLALHDTTPTAACDRYGADSLTDNSSDFWYLAVDVNDDVSGDHEVSLIARNDSPTNTALVTLLHRRNGAFVESYQAVAGTVSLDTVPSPQDAANEQLRGHMEIDFPSPSGITSKPAKEDHFKSGQRAEARDREIL